MGYFFKHNRFLRIIASFMMMIGLFATYACERIYEEPTDNVDIAVAFATDLHVPLHFYRDMEHVFLRLSNQGFFQQVCDEIADEIGANIVLLDSVMSGDDSVFLRIEFDPNKPNRFNQMRKSGSVKLTIYSDYTEFGSKQIIEIDSLNPYTFERSDGLTYSFAGWGFLQKEMNKIGLLNVRDAELLKTTKNGIQERWALQAQWQFALVFGATQDGLASALIAAEGEGTFKQTTSKKELSWLITLPLRLNPEFGCANYATSGMVRLDEGFTRYNINFDPFETNACNKIIEVSKGGTSFESKLP